MTAFLALVRKDLVLYFSNRRSLTMVIVAPILIAAFFGSLFGDWRSAPAAIPVAVTDLDGSTLSKRVVEALRDDAALSVQEDDPAAASAAVRTGKVRAAVLLPAGFGPQLTRAMHGKATGPQVVLTYDPSQTVVLPILRGLLGQHVLAAAGETSVGNTADKASSAGMPFTTRTVEAGARLAGRYNSYAHAFAGMGVQFILLMGVDMAVALLAMRRMGLWQRLRAAPLSRTKLLGSRVASTALIALIVFLVIYAVAMVGFGVRVDGSVIGFIGVLLAFALLTASFGLLVAAIGRTPEATRGLAILATLLLVMLGGARVPAFVFPAWLQTITFFVPTRWAIDGLDAMTWRAQPIEAALQPIGVMLGYAAAFALLAAAWFRWEE